MNVWQNQFCLDRDIEVSENTEKHRLLKMLRQDYFLKDLEFYMNRDIWVDFCKLNGYYVRNQPLGAW